MKMCLILLSFTLVFHWKKANIFFNLTVKIFVMLHIGSTSLRLGKAIYNLEILTYDPSNAFNHPALIISNLTKKFIGLQMINRDFILFVLDENSNRYHHINITIDHVTFPLQNALIAGQTTLDKTAQCYVRYKFYDKGTSLSLKIFISRKHSLLFSICFTKNGFPLS